MRILSITFRALTAIVLTTASQAYGAPANQAPLNQPTHAAGRTAVIDLGHIFDNSIFVKGEVEKIRVETEATLAKFKGIEADLRKHKYCRSALTIAW